MKNEIIRKPIKEKNKRIGYRFEKKQNVLLFLFGLFVVFFTFISGVQAETILINNFNMTSNTTPSPYITSASTEQTNLWAWKAFDNLYDEPAHYFQSGSGLPVWLKIDLGAGNSSIVNLYSIDAYNSASYAPKDWTFQGSNDGTTWTILDTKTNQFFTSGNASNYSISNTNAYRYYRFNVSAVSASTILIVDEVDLYYVVAPTALYSPCNESITANSTGTNLFFNWTATNNLTNTTIRGKYYNISTDFEVSEQGNNVLVGFKHGTYYLYINQTYNGTTNTEYYADCTLDVCLNNWERTPQPCVDSLRLINYTDTNSCSEAYDIPSDNGDSEDCVIQANTDRDLWLIIFFLVIWFISSLLTIFVSPLFSIGGFVSGVAFLYYTNIYFSTSLGGILILSMSVLFLFVGIGRQRMYN